MGKTDYKGALGLKDFELYKVALFEHLTVLGQVKWIEKKIKIEDIQDNSTPASIKDGTSTTTDKIESKKMERATISLKIRASLNKEHAGRIAAISDRDLWEQFKTIIKAYEGDNEVRYNTLSRPTQESMYRSALIFAC
ncbi:hypothetical protein HYFRA_00013281 [Hymenoscyphus fraxineus]|uniref:Uncharacterized protein n=1 Tax=Hymenoscyphus fraxineus TaxID=746836 RepID=A0A9N9L6E5_9HELO|nr:hypothetical protein HYFRA_00013281 [Hymenoscyphus fraxineus]